MRTDESGALVEGGMGYRDFYSLANNAYWYVNEYEGLDLYKLLCYLGMETVEEMGRAIAGAPVLYLQTYRDSGDTVGAPMTAYTPAETEELADALRPYARAVFLRGV